MSKRFWRDEPVPPILEHTTGVVIALLLVPAALPLDLSLAFEVDPPRFFLGGSSLIVSSLLLAEEAVVSSFVVPSISLGTGVLVVGFERLPLPEVDGAARGVVFKSFDGVEARDSLLPLAVPSFEMAPAPSPFLPLGVPS